MDIEYHRNFIRNFKKRFGSNQKIKKQYKERLRLFINNPQHPFLHDHALKRENVMLRVFSISGDVRVIYIRIGKRIIFLDIGTHNQIY